VVNAGVRLPDAPAEPPPVDGRREARMAEHDRFGGLSVDLRELARHPDEPTPDLLARTVHRLVQRYCRARLGALPSGYALADDLTAEITADLLRDRRRRFGRPLPVEAVVYPLMADAVGRALARASPAGPDAAGRVGVPGGVPLEVLKELNRLPRGPREVLVLRAFVGLSSEQVGRAMGLTMEQVRHEQHRALVHLRSP
jgi:RNA polymerase sigma-70 factor, ECF subfamily